MTNKYHIPRLQVDNFGRTRVVAPDLTRFNYILGYRIEDIISFEDSTQDMIGKDMPILPRYYHIFVGIKDGDIQFKPYEYDQYRIVVSVYNNIISSIESIG